MDKSNTWVIYGANGYTGRLIVEEALKKGLQPIISGRNAIQIEEMANQYNLPHQVVSLKNIEDVEALIKDAKIVLNCAGPFEDTCQAFIEPCLKNKTHYLDITGEIPVFETFAAQNRAALETGIMMMPGVGFDVVPTDCLAKHLANEMPDATHLELAFMSVGGRLSHGTATTMIRNLGMGGAIRRDGKIIKVRNAYKSKEIRFEHKEVLCATIPWGDVSTAWYSTSIPNIEVYLAVGKRGLRSMKWGNYLGWILRQPWVKKRMISKVKSGPAGPSDEQRQTAKSNVWGRVTNAQGEVMEARLFCGEGYTLTAETAILITEKVLNDNWQAGFQTPAKAYGADLILEASNVVRKMN